MQDLTENRALGPEAPPWPRERVLRVAGWTLVIGGFFLSESLDLGVTWLPGVGVLVMVAHDLLEAYRKRLAVRLALTRLRECFSRASEPDLSAIFAALAGAEALTPTRVAMQWSERFQRGMMPRSEYYSGMRQFVETHGAGR